MEGQLVLSVADSLHDVSSLVLGTLEFLRPVDRVVVDWCIHQLGPSASYTTVTATTVGPLDQTE